VPVLRDGSLRLWQAAIFGATLLLVLTVGFILASSALKLPAKASARVATGEQAVAAAAGAAAGSAARFTPPPPPPPAPPPPDPPAPRTTAAGTVWLCRPGLADNPCTQSLDATAVAADGTRTPIGAQPDTGSRFDCFYAYPTVSLQGSDNASLAVEQPQIDIAVEQASRFSQVCKVWAPIWRQRTKNGTPADVNAAAEVAYESLLSAWKDYMANFNQGRPVVIIGHSQGAIVLARLIASQVDPNPAVRRQVVSALLIGGNVGGFPSMPACRSPKQIGCVIAYSSYYEQPPDDAIFGRLGGLCTNPANLGGGAGALDPYLLVDNAWVNYPGLYSASCVSAGGATWLQVNVAPGDPRPHLAENLGPAWGLHEHGDVNLALGNLVQDVATEESAFP
jgi:Protein of unknown function (DUF3089)